MSNHNTATPCSHKARRLQQKAKSQRRGLHEETTVVPATVVSAETSTSDGNAECYECFICGDELAPQNGIVACEEHFMCSDCAISSFSIAVRDQEAFPAKCCKPLHRRAFEGVVPHNVMRRYKKKCVEHYTPLVIRVYCKGCGTFVPQTSFRDDTWHTVAECACGTETCVGCKEAWSEGHLCNSGDDAVKPDWLPEYTNDCRIKRCPGCKLWIEHKEACNHMTCSHCDHQFCFICLLPWSGSHEAEGCPLYGEPRVGYDEEGYERSSRGLHLQTGLNREGNDRHGLPPSSRVAAQLAGQAEEDLEQAWNNDGPINEENFGEPEARGNWFPEAENEYEAAEDWEDEDEDEDDWVDEAEYHMDDLDPEAEGEGIALVQQHEGQDGGLGLGLPPAWDEQEPPRRGFAARAALSRYLRLRQMEREEWEARLPYCAGGNLSYTVLDCAHRWRYQSQYGGCAICHFFMNLFRYQCEHCRMVVCQFCTSSFESRLSFYHPDAARLTLFELHEGIVPFKAERRRKWIDFQNYEQEWNIDTMFEAAEEELYETQPFMYHDFGIARLFADAERELGPEQWYAIVENVGIPGCTFSFRINNNSFAPLSEFDAKTY